jgi:hypothetical protein
VTRRLNWRQYYCALAWVVCQSACLIRVRLAQNILSTNAKACKFKEIDLARGQLVE